VNAGAESVVVVPWLYLTLCALLLSGRSSWSSPARAARGVPRRQMPLRARRAPRLAEPVACRAAAACAATTARGRRATIASIPREADARPTRGPAVRRLRRALRSSAAPRTQTSAASIARAASTTVDCNAGRPITRAVPRDPAAPTVPSRAGIRRRAPCGIRTTWDAPCVFRPPCASAVPRARAAMEIRAQEADARPARYAVVSPAPAAAGLAPAGCSFRRLSATPLAAPGRTTIACRRPNTCVSRASRCPPPARRGARPVVLRRAARSPAPSSALAAPV
jgi:hypothetical protein